MAMSDDGNPDQGTDLVEVPRMACIPKTDIEYILSFSKGQYAVPEDKIISVARKHNKIDSPEELGKLLATKAPDKWEEYCHPDTLIRISGEEGNCVYTTFEVPGHESEKAHLHLISATIAEKNFPKMLTKHKDIEREQPKQKKRWATLSWEKKVDLPIKAQINPEINRWVSRPDAVKSCAKAPETKKRPKGSSGEKRSREEDEQKTLRKFYMRKEIFFEVGAKGTYAINEIDGCVHVIQYPTPDVDEADEPPAKDDDDDAYA